MATFSAVGAVPGGDLVADSVTAAQIVGKIGDPGGVDRQLIAGQAPLVGGALVIASGLAAALAACADLVAPTAPPGAGVTSFLNVQPGVPGAGDVTIQGVDIAGAPALDAPVINWVAWG